MKIIEKPKASEFQSNEPLLANLIPEDGLLLEHLMGNFQNTKSFILSLPADKLLFRYENTKWTIKEIISHLIDMERIYCDRMLRFARNDQNILPGFDADKYVLYSCSNDRHISCLLTEFESVRNSTVVFLDGLANEALLRYGKANGYNVTVRALAYHIAGHELHHVTIIKERYLK